MMNTITEIKITNLKNHPKNSRRVYNGLSELAASIAKNGILQNLTVVPDPDEDGTYFVVVGNRRLKAAQKAGLETVPCVITDMDESEQVMTTLVENMQRNDLTLEEEAAGIQMCIEDYGIDVGTLAEKIGFSKSTIRHRLNVSKLDQKILSEKLHKAEFQLSITDIQKLERIKSIERRNIVLAAAADPRDLSCKIEQAVHAEQRDQKVKKLLTLAENEGIGKVPEGVDHYLSCWKIVTEVHLYEENVPETLLPEDFEMEEGDELYYVLLQMCFHVIHKKAEKKDEPPKETEAEKSPDQEEKPQPEGKGAKPEPEEKKPKISPEQLRLNLIQSHRSRFRDLWDNCYAELHDFHKDILEGKIDPPEDADALLKACWTLFLQDDFYPDHDALFHAVYECLGDEGEDVTARAMDLLSDMPVYLQMLTLLFYEMSDFSLMDHSAEYDVETGRVMRQMVDCFRQYGFSFSTEGHDELIDGFHPVYLCDGEETSDLEEASGEAEEDGFEDADEETETEPDDAEDSGDGPEETLGDEELPGARAA